MKGETGVQREKPRRKRNPAARRKRLPRRKVRRERNRTRVRVMETRATFGNALMERVKERRSAEEEQKALAVRGEGVDAAVGGVVPTASGIGTNEGRGEGNRNGGGNIKTRGSGIRAGGGENVAGGEEGQGEGEVGAGKAETPRNPTTWGLSAGCISSIRL